LQVARLQLHLFTLSNAVLFFLIRIFIVESESNRSNGSKPIAQSLSRSEDDSDDDSDEEDDDSDKDDDERVGLNQHSSRKEDIGEKKTDKQMAGAKLMSLKRRNESDGANEGVKLKQRKQSNDDSNARPSSMYGILFMLFFLLIHTFFVSSVASTSVLAKTQMQAPHVDNSNSSDNKDGNYNNNKQNADELV
jgi:hypothetical protein